MVIQSATPDNSIQVGSKNWNVADMFAKFKIMKLMMELDDQEKTAMFGRANEEEMFMQEEIPQRRVEALNKMVFLLKQLVGNCKFAIKEAKDKETISELFERIEQVEEVMDEISQTIVNEVTKENFLEINERHFKKCFEVLRNIKDELNFPLDHASLIFRHGEEVDLDDIMRQITEGG